MSLDFQPLIQSSKVGEATAPLGLLGMFGLAFAFVALTAIVINMLLIPMVAV
jgi:hypothetical protein